MSTSQCGRCGTAFKGPCEYVLDGQRLCALCYGLALSAGSDRSAHLPGDDPLVRLDETGVAGSDGGRPAAEAQESAPPASPPEPPVDSFAGTSAGRRGALLLPAGARRAGAAGPRIEDDSLRLPTHRGRRLASRDGWSIS
jgi:hypothetical protein